MSAGTEVQAGGSLKTWLPRAGAIILLAMGAVHVLVYVGFSLSPGYPGFLFLLNAALSLVLAIGVFANVGLAWPAAALLAAGTIALYIVVHTVGLPGFYLEDWLSTVGFLPLGPISVVGEAAIIGIYLIDRLTRSQRRSVTAS